MPIIDYKTPDAPRTTRTRSGLILAFTAAALSFVPWLLGPLEHDPVALGIDVVVVSMIVSGISAILQVFWVVRATESGWLEPAIAATAFLSTFFWWVFSRV